MRIRLAATAIAAGLLLGGCFSDSSSNGTEGVGPTDPTTGNGSGSIPPTPAGVGAFKAVFVAGGGIFPYPIDLYFNGSTDGTLNIPASTVYPQRTSMNALDGFSTTASSYFRFSQPVRNDATMLNSNVRIVEMIMLRQSTGVYAPVATSPLRGANPILAPGVDYAVRLAPETDAAGTEVEIVWLKPLNASAGVYCPAPLPTTAICGIGYIVLVTNGIQNTAATPVAATPDADYMTVRNEAIAELTRAQTPPNNPATYSPTCPGITNATLNGICRLTYAHLGTGARLPAPATINPTSVIVSYSFTTQSTRDALVNLAATLPATEMSAVNTGQRSNALIPALPGITNVYTGSLVVPYYLTPPSAGDPTGPLTKSWTAAGASTVPGIAATSRDITRFNLTPLKVADVRMPAVIFVPNGFSPGGGVKPANGWPVVIFMHGLRSNRSTAAAIADTYASQGFVTIAIDQVLHGLAPSATNPLYAGTLNPAYSVLYPAGTRERTFDVDYQNNATGAYTPDGVVDGSGAHAINLSSPLVTRDIARQIGADLITLTKTLIAGGLDLDGVAGGDIDPARIHYAGISLGAIAGAACVCSTVQSFYLNVPGGPLPVILRTSPSFSSTINAGLAAVNPLLQPGTALYSQFFRELQAIWDAGDPTNYIRSLAATKPVVFTKVVNDSVVPNVTNDYLILASGATKVSAAGSAAVAAGAPKYVTFLSNQPFAATGQTAGNGPVHSSLLDPFGLPAATAEMQQHALTLAAFGGTAFLVSNSALLQP